MDCTDASERITALVDGELPADERPSLDAHLADCAPCRRNLDEERAVAARVASLPRPPLPEGFREAVMTGVRAAAPPAAAPPAGGRVLSFWPWLAGGAALAAGILLMVNGSGSGPGYVAEVSAPRAMPSAATGDVGTGGDATGEARVDDGSRSRRDAAPPGVPEGPLRKPKSEALPSRDKDVPDARRPAGEIPPDSRSPGGPVPVPAPTEPAGVPAPPGEKGQAKKAGEGKDEKGLREESKAARGDPRRPAESESAEDDSATTFHGKEDADLGGEPAELDRLQKDGEAETRAKAPGDREAPGGGAPSAPETSLRDGVVPEGRTALVTGPAVVALFLRVPDVDRGVVAVNALFSRDPTLVRERAWMRSAPTTPGATAATSGAAAATPGAGLVGGNYSETELRAGGKASGGGGSGGAGKNDAADGKPGAWSTDPALASALESLRTLDVPTLAARVAPPGQRVIIVRAVQGDLPRVRRALATLEGFTETHSVVLRDPEADRLRAMELARARLEDRAAKPADGAGAPVGGDEEETSARESRELLEHSDARTPGTAAGEPVPPPAPDRETLRRMAEDLPAPATPGVLAGDRRRDILVEIHLLGPDADPVVETFPAPAPKPTAPPDPPEGGR